MVFKITAKTRKRFKINNPRIVGIKPNGLPRVQGQLRDIKPWDPEKSRSHNDRKPVVYQSKLAVGLSGEGKPLDMDKLGAIHGLRVGREWHIQVDATGSLWVNFDPRAIHTDTRITAASVKLGIVRENRFIRNTRIPHVDQLNIAFRMFGDHNALDKVWKAAAAAAAAYRGKVSKVDPDRSDRPRRAVLEIPRKQPEPPKLRRKPDPPVLKR